VGYHKIPINHAVLKEVKTLGLDPDLTEKSLETNMHNNPTTSYYLLLRKELRDGKISRNSVKVFDKLVL
jgi:5'-AMP-activated protein kinase, catalytic alpha subunit